MKKKKKKLINFNDNLNDQKADQYVTPPFNEGNIDNNNNDNNNNEFDNIDLSVLNWKKIKLSSKTKSYKIRNLSHGWSYLVRIRGKNDNGFGLYSLPIKISTKTIKLSWDKRKHGRGLTFISSSRIKFSSKQSKCCVDYKIRSKTHKVFSWEFKLHKISNYTWIGFIKGPTKSVSSWSTFLGGNNYNEFSVGFGSGSKNLSIQNQSGHNHGQSIPLQRSVRTGDRFKFKANMKSKTVTIYHNSKNCGAIFQNIPTYIVPACSNNSSHMDISVNFAS